MIYSDELLAVAKRIFCFGAPEEAMEFPIRFLTYTMTYASDEDIEILKKYFSDDEFKAALDDPALGFSTKALGQNGINATAVPPFRRFRSDAFQAQTRPQFLISFLPNPEHWAWRYQPSGPDEHRW